MSQASLVTPIGTLSIVADRNCLLGVRIGGADASSAPRRDDALPLVEEALRQLAAWFAGTLDRFDLPLAPAGTPRGAALRAAIEGVGYGETESYGVVSRRIDSSPRAIGQACARNPFPLIVPCHRIVGAGGTIGHYSAGAGIATKRWLLAFEARRAHPWAT